MTKEEIKEAEKNEPIEKLKTGKFRGGTIDKPQYGEIYPELPELFLKINEIIEALNKLNIVVEDNSSEADENT